MKTEENIMLGFVLGAIFGGTLGVLIMCLFILNKEVK